MSTDHNSPQILFCYLLPLLKKYSGLISRRFLYALEFRLVILLDCMSGLNVILFRVAYDI